MAYCGSGDRLLDRPDHYKGASNPLDNGWRLPVHQPIVIISSTLGCLYTSLRIGLSDSTLGYLYTPAFAY